MIPPSVIVGVREMMIDSPAAGRHNHGHIADGGAVHKEERMLQQVARAINVCVF